MRPYDSAPGPPLSPLSCQQLVSLSQSSFVSAVDYTEAEFLDEIQTKVLRVFLLDIRSHLYSFTLKFLFLQTHATSYSFYSSVTVQYTVKEKGGTFFETSSSSNLAIQLAHIREFS